MSPLPKFKQDQFKRSKSRVRLVKLIPFLADIRFILELKEVLRKLPKASDSMQDSLWEQYLYLDKVIESQISQRLFWAQFFILSFVFLTSLGFGAFLVFRDLRGIFF